jgi:hypothetical protein
MPNRYPSGVTCWRRLRDWEERDVWLDAWRALLGTLDRRGLLRWEETFLDGSFAPAKKGAKQSGKRSVVRARSGWYWSTAKVFLWEHSSRLPRRTK